MHKKFNQKGFSLAEALIMLLIVGVISAATVPMMTKMSENISNSDEKTLDCISANSSTGWYNETTGATSDPEAGSTCGITINNIIYKKENTLYSTIRTADNGTSAEKLIAKKLLRAACDNGSAKACDYFINTCWKSGSANIPFCDDTATFLDLTYYLHQTTSSTNKGVAYIKTKMQTQLTKNVTNLFNQISYACSYNQSPNNGQNLNSNIACDLTNAQFLITACNNGYTGACYAAYSRGYNTSCTAAKTNWATAPTGTYKLTTDDSETTRDVTCNMTNAATAAISGCNANPYVSDDCTAGYNGSYNRTCSNVFANYGLASATYNLTSSGPPPTAPVSTACSPVSACIASNTPGTVCDDGTVYVGRSGSYYFFTTPADIGQYSWNNGTTNYYTTGLTTDVYGMTNTNTLVQDKTTTFDYPYQAAKACYDLSYGYRTDWYLPVLSEFTTYYVPNKVAIGNFQTNYYWTSVEGATYNGAKYYNFASSSSSNALKDRSYYVRCMRRQTL